MVRADRVDVSCHSTRQFCMAGQEGRGAITAGWFRSSAKNKHAPWTLRRTKYLRLYNTSFHSTLKLVAFYLKTAILKFDYKNLPKGLNKCSIIVTCVLTA
jgi:hypothetical protein